MQRPEFITYKGKTILLEDFSYVNSTTEFIEILKEVEKMFLSQPEGSVLALFDATKAQYTSASLNFLKEVTQRTTPHTKATAVVGIEGLMVIALKSVNRFANRDFKVAKSREEAMDWLIEQ